MQMNATSSQVSKVLPGTDPCGVWKALGKFIHLSAVEQRLLVEALLWLTLARLAIPAVPFRRIAPLLGRTMEETPFHVTEGPPVAEGVSQAIRTAADHAPWKSRCLVRAVAAQWMLKRRGIGSTLYLGVSKEDTKVMSAHAWVRCGDKFLTGAVGRRETYPGPGK